MKKNLTVLLVMAIAGAGFTVLGGDHPEKKAPIEKKEMVSQPAYVCPDCESLALQEGKCVKCGKDLKATHVLCVKEGQAMLCECTPGCKCDPEGMKDGKCACGTAVKKVGVKGMYVCIDGCPEISAKPGVCMCGKQLKKVE